jgi:Protein of unknown function (DUF3325)
MPETLWLMAALATGFAGFAALALAMERHWGEVGPVPLPGLRRRLLLRLLGVAGLVVSLSLCWLRDGASFGSVSGLLVWSLSAVSVALLLSWRPRWLARVQLMLGERR